METINNREDLYLWYRQPARDWNEALPVGNGRLGAMVFGRIVKERIQLNEDSLWSGGAMQRNNPAALAHLPEIREYLFAGRIREAEKLALLALSGIPWNMRHYQTLGDLNIEFDYPGGTGSAPAGYVRELALERGVVSTRYTVGEVAYNREVFASFPDQVLVVRITADTPGAVSCRVNLSRLNECDKVGEAAADTIALSGSTGGEEGIRFAAALRGVATRGTLPLIGEHLVVRNADSVLLLLAAATSFRAPGCLAEALACLEQAVRKPYASLLDNHITDYKSLFNRVSFFLYPVNRELNLLPTDARLGRVKQGKADPGLDCLYFQFGRYLLISSSRPGSLPANLQGIWNESLDPPWGSKYTININIQMNYWPAENCNLAECHLPLFDLIRRMQEPGRETARLMYGCRGFTAHHNTDIWGDTAPQDNYLPATYWPLGAAWLCLHLWEHYLFGQDRFFLKEAYPVMREALLFFQDFLVLDHQGRLVTCPSVSPENTYVLANGEKGCLVPGPTMDSQIIRALCGACIQAAAILGIDEDDRKTLEALLEKLPVSETGQYGQLREWVEDYMEEEPGHRHISHLFGLYPAHQITLRGTPETARAARIALERRLTHGGGHTGWSRAWIINLWARLEEGDKSYVNLQELLKQSTLPNLFDNHPPFQIDGNFGGCAGIAEMLLQSGAGEIGLLPALPAAWAGGKVTGLRARGGYEVDITWEQHELKEAVIRASCSGTVSVRYGAAVAAFEIAGGKKVVLDCALRKQ